MIMLVRKHRTDFSLPGEPPGGATVRAPHCRWPQGGAQRTVFPSTCARERTSFPSRWGSPRGLCRGPGNLPARFSPFRGCGKRTLVKPHSPIFFICLLTLYPVSQPKARDPSVVIFQLTVEEKFKKYILSITPGHQMVMP